MSTTIKTALLALATYAALGAVGYAYRDHPAVQQHLHQLNLTHDHNTSSGPQRFSPGP